MSIRNVLAISFVVRTAASTFLNLPSNLLSHASCKTKSWQVGCGGTAKTCRFLCQNFNFLWTKTFAVRPYCVTFLPFSLRPECCRRSVLCPHRWLARTNVDVALVLPCGFMCFCGWRTRTCTEICVMVDFGRGIKRDQVNWFAYAFNPIRHVMVTKGSLEFWIAVCNNAVGLQASPNPLKFCWFTHAISVSHIALKSLKKMRWQGYLEMVVIFLAWCLPTIAALQFYESMLGHKRLVDPIRKLFCLHKLKDTSRTYNPIPFAMCWGHIFYDTSNLTTTTVLNLALQCPRNALLFSLWWEILHKCWLGGALDAILCVQRFPRRRPLKAQGSVANPSRSSRSSWCKRSSKSRKGSQHQKEAK